MHYPYCHCHIIKLEAQTKAKLLVTTLWIYALLGTTQWVVHICCLINKNQVFVKYVRRGVLPNS